MVLKCNIRRAPRTRWSVHFSHEHADLRLNILHLADTLLNLSTRTFNSPSVLLRINTAGFRAGLDF